MDVESLVASVDIVEYIGQYVDLEEKGGEWWGLSPFNEEKTPSFSIRRTPPVFYDFSSGASGGILAFIKLYHRVSGYEAVEMLKKYAGYEGEIEGQTAKLAVTQTIRKYQASKPPKTDAKGTVLPPDVMEQYEICPEKLAAWKNEGISDASLRKFDVRYDRFSDRIVYPIRNMNGEIVNIGGRTLDPDWKEKNLRKYTYFYHWGTMNVLYGLWENIGEIRKRGEIILFEGAKSVLIADTWGIHNTAAVLTSHLNPQQMKVLASLGCRTVFALDKEIVASNDGNIRKLSHYVRCETLRDPENLLEAKDAPVDKGRDVFDKLYASRVRIKGD